MAAAATQQQVKIRCGDLEDGDGGDLLPPRVVTRPDENDLRKVKEHRLDDEANKIAAAFHTTVRKLARMRLSKSGSWSKFSNSVEDARSRIIIGFTEEILERPRTPGSEADEQTASGDPQTETFVDRPPTADGLAEPPICQICMRPVDVMRRRNAEASVRVTNLSMDTRECDLVDLFCPFGLINRAYLAVDEKADSSTRFGIVDYDQSVDAEKAISWLNGFPYDNLILQVEWATPRQQDACVPTMCPSCMRATENSVRVTNLSDDTHEPDLLDLFCPFGLVTCAYIAVDEKTGSRKRFGIVEFVHREDAERAIWLLNGYAYDNHILRVEGPFRLQDLHRALGV